ncbi:MAG: permease [Pirellulales bacterium]|nr:permease [Pirellulales bacterium]
MLDNTAALLLMVGLLGGAFGFPESFALRYMIPGTALGVLVGDLLFTWMAFRLARRSGRNDITAMPLGIDTPSTFGMVFFVLGPAYLAGKATGLAEQDAAIYAWRIGMCAIITSGVFKLACSLAAHWMRQVVPRAGLLGSLAAIALVLISFLPLLEVARVPVVGFLSLALILATLVSRLSLPGRIPGALGAVLVGTTVYYLMTWTGTLGAASIDQTIQTQIGFVLPLPTLEWWEVFRDSLVYLPIVIPFALATVVGGIDCTESAAAVGDEYNTGHVVAVEAVATLVAGLCGGVIQTTPYIGHPAYKAMGGRAAYTLATALFIGGAGIFGYFAYLYLFIPKAAILPILVFIGLEISSQSFHATPTRHYPAVVFGCVPALAYLVMIYADRLLGILAQSGTTLDTLEAGLASELQTMRMLSAGFIVTSLLWASTLVAMIDRRLKQAAAYLAVAAVASLFGVIHSPLPGGSMVLPWALPELPKAAAGQTPFYLAAAYALTAAMLFGWGMWRPEDANGNGDSADEGHHHAPRAESSA